MNEIKINCINRITAETIDNFRFNSLLLKDLKEIYPEFLVLSKEYIQAQYRWTHNIVTYDDNRRMRDYLNLPIIDKGDTDVVSWSPEWDKNTLDAMEDACKFHTSFSVDKPFLGDNKNYQTVHLIIKKDANDTSAVSLRNRLYAFWNQVFYFRALKAYQNYNPLTASKSDYLQLKKYFHFLDRNCWLLDLDKSIIDPEIIDTYVSIENALAVGFIAEKHGLNASFSNTNPSYPGGDIIRIGMKFMILTVKNRNDNIHQKINLEFWKDVKEYQITVLKMSEEQIKIGF